LVVEHPDARLGVVPQHLHHAGRVHQVVLEERR
jgi:hypothetical protein